MNKILLICLGVLLITLASATFYPEPWGNNQDAGDNNLTNVNYISANHLNITELTVSDGISVTGNITGLNCIVFDNGAELCGV